VEDILKFREATMESLDKKIKKLSTEIDKLSTEIGRLSTPAIRRRLAANPLSQESLTPDTSFLPSPGSSAVSIGVVATAALCLVFVLRRFYNRFTAKRRDSLGFLPDSRRESLNAAERMV